MDALAKEELTGSSGVLSSLRTETVVGDGIVVEFTGSKALLP